MLPAASAARVGRRPTAPESPLSTTSAPPAGHARPRRPAPPAGAPGRPPRPAERTRTAARPPGPRSRPRRRAGERPARRAGPGGPGGREGDHGEAVRVALDDVHRLGADRSRGTEQGDGAGGGHGSILTVVHPAGPTGTLVAGGEGPLGGPPNGRRRIRNPARGSGRGTAERAAVPAGPPGPGEPDDGTGVPAVAPLRPARPGTAVSPAGVLLPGLVLLGLALPLGERGRAGPATPTAPAAADRRRAARCRHLQHSRPPRQPRWAPRTAPPLPAAQLAIRSTGRRPGWRRRVPASSSRPEAGTQFVRSGWLDTLLAPARAAGGGGRTGRPGHSLAAGRRRRPHQREGLLQPRRRRLRLQRQRRQLPRPLHRADRGTLRLRPRVGDGATNWAFVPGYANGKAPYGVFPARHLATTTGWRTTEDFDVDVAFADVGPNASGTALGDSVGGQTIGFGTPRGGMLHAFGYPAAAPWTGETLVHCAALVVQDRGAEPSQDQGMKCAMTPGSSGGPVVRGLLEPDRPRHARARDELLLQRQARRPLGPVPGLDRSVAVRLGGVDPRRLSRQTGMPTYFVSRYSSIPSTPPSRPKPDCLTPPNGAAGLDTMPWLSRPCRSRGPR